jgi:DNA-binding SARP family transcriptional activator
MAITPAEYVLSPRELADRVRTDDAVLLPEFNDRQRAHGLLQHVLRQQQSLVQDIEDLTDALIPRMTPPSSAIAEIPAGPKHQVSVLCLGTFELYIDSLPVQGWRSGRARALLQYLVSRHDRPASRDALIQALWPEPDAVAAASSLKVAVHALRQVLSANQSADGAPALSVRAHESSYELSVVGQLWLDTEQFEKSCARARRFEADGQVDAARLEFAHAAELYRGEFLPDAWDDWALLRREHLRDAHLYVLARLADFVFEDGHYDACIHWCEQLLADDRCREDTYRLLMRCHGRLGQPGRVRRWFELCEHTLRADLGVEVDAETEHEYRLALRESSHSRRTSR